MGAAAFAVWVLILPVSVEEGVDGWRKWLKHLENWELSMPLYEMFGMAGFWTATVFLFLIWGSLFWPGPRLWRWYHGRDSRRAKSIAKELDKIYTKKEAERIVRAFRPPPEDSEGDR